MKAPKGAFVVYNRYMRKVGVLLLALIISFQLSAADFAFAQQQVPDEQAQLEQQLAELEKQIAQDQATIDAYNKQGKTLSKEISALNAEINKHNLQIKAISLTLSKLDGDILTTQKDITKTQSQLDTNKIALTKLVRNLYEADRTGITAILLKSSKLSDFFGDVNNLLNAQDAIVETVYKISDLKSQLVQKKDDLSDKRSNAAALKASQDAQKAAADKAKKEKNNLLAETKGQESKYQTLVQEKKKTAAEIRNRIFRFLGGGELPFGEAVKLAQVAEKATGVRASFILAILTQESSISGVIGANLGSCHYNTPRNNASGTVMKNDQKPNFLALMSELGLDPNNTPVSCPIASDGAYGGAMGPAQFMPNTWIGYKDQVSAITGGNPASPFNNLDAFTGTALYLKNSLNATACKNYASQNQNVYPYQFLLERCAAARYYAGGRWYAYRLGYGDDVATRSEKFQSDIDVLNS